MPRETQDSITVPSWLWDLVKSEFESKKGYYVKVGIKSPTRLVQVWILDHLHLRP